MQNSFDLSLNKLRMPEKCVTFEQKLHFTKFKSLNCSDFHQKLKFLSNFWKKYIYFLIFESEITGRIFTPVLFWSKNKRASKID